MKSHMPITAPASKILEMKPTKLGAVLIFLIFCTESCLSPPTRTPQVDMQIQTPYQITRNSNILNQVTAEESTAAASYSEQTAQCTDEQIQDLVLSTSFTPQMSPENIQTDLTPSPELSLQITKIIERSGGRWHIVIKEIGGQTHYTLRPEQRINIASVVKVPIALLFFAALAEKGIPEENLLDHIRSTGTDGRTFDQLLRAMLVISEEDATAILSDYITIYLNVPAQLRRWNIEGIDLNARRYTALGVANIFERFYLGEFINPTARGLMLEYLGEYSPNDNGRIGVLNTPIPENWRLYNKRGSLLTPYVVADSAILENKKGRDYVITIFAYNSDPKTTYENLDHAIGEIALAFWDQISSPDIPNK